MQFSNIFFNTLEIIVVGVIFFIFVQLIINKIEYLQIKKHGIQKQIINSAYLQHKYMTIKNNNYQDERYQAVYLIQYEDYDTEVAIRTPIEGITLNYPVSMINNCLYVLVDTIETNLQTGLNYVIEDNYTKAILIISPDQEYFYLNVIHPRKVFDDENELGFIHKNKVTGIPQITREDLKYYRILGLLKALIK